MTTIARLRDLEGQATPGPWLIWSHVGQPEIDRVTGDIIGAYPPACQGVLIGGVNATSTKGADSELIAAMRHALPALLLVAEAARDLARYDDLAQPPCEACSPADPEPLAAARDALRSALDALDGME